MQSTIGEVPIRAERLISAGVDIGATWLRLSLRDASGKRLGRLRASAPRADRIGPAIRKILNRLNCRPDFIVVGSTGMGDEKKLRALRAALRPLATRAAIVTTDLEIAARSVFPNGEGILAVAGTGSVVWGRDRRGRISRHGGWGPLLGDEGSAFWIAKQWIAARYSEKEILRYAYRPDSVRAVAAIAPKVLAAQSKDSLARRIVEEGQIHLARHVAAAVDDLNFPGPAPVAGFGGLFQNKRFKESFARRLKKTIRRPIRWVESAGFRRPEDAAAMTPFELPSVRPNYRIRP